VIVIAPRSKRTFVARLDFCTTVGHGDGPGDRERLRFRGAGPTGMITDLGVLEPDPQTKQLRLTAIHPGVEVQQVLDATGFELAVAAQLEVTGRGARRPARADESFHVSAQAYRPVSVNAELRLPPLAFKL
jgi:glutaconate CoA-transferase subunit B